VADFDVENVVFSDYQTQDVNGKAVWAGVYFADIRFNDRPLQWPMIFINLVLVPKSKNIEFSIEFNSPSGQNMFKMDGKARSENNPERSNRTIISLQIPPVPFEGPGEYQLRIKDEHDHLVKTQSLFASIGPPDANLTEIEATFHVNPALQPKFGRPVGWSEKPVF